MNTVRVQSEPFDTGAELNRFAAAQDGAGGVVSFTGVVRNTARGDLEAMEIEHYPGMTRKALERIAAEAASRWPLTGSLVIHRHGRLVPGETIMMVATASAHRGAAFQAAEFLMDYLKSRAPFWKKEITTQGAGWVDAKTADEQALDRWQKD